MRKVQELLDSLAMLPAALELDITNQEQADEFEKKYPNLLEHLAKVYIVAEELTPPDEIDALVLLEDALGAYPTSIFKPVSKGERDRLKRRYPGLQERLAAEMGRHIGEVVLIPVRAELMRLLANQREEEVPIL